MSHATNVALSEAQIADKQETSNEFAFDDLPTMELRRQIYVDLMRIRQDFPASHRNAVARILFIFAKMHPDISYVQVHFLSSFHSVFIRYSSCVPEPGVHL